MAKKKGKTKVSELEKLNQDLLDLRLKHASMALKETHKISETKKEIHSFDSALEMWHKKTINKKQNKK